MLAATGASTLAASPPNSGVVLPVQSQSGLLNGGLSYPVKGQAQPLVTQPAAWTVEIGTGDFNTNDYKEDASEPSGYDTYLTLEDTSSSWNWTCAPNATHNILTHFGPALSVSGLISVEDSTPSNGTDWGNALTGLNTASDDTWTLAPRYTWGSSPGWDSSSTTVWQDMYNDAISTLYGYNEPTLLAMSGEDLPGFPPGNEVHHYVAVFGYYGFGSGFSNEGIDYFDSWMGHVTPGEYWFTEPISYMSSENVVVEHLAY